MSTRGVRRSPPSKNTIEREARLEAERAVKPGARASSKADSPPGRALTIREKIVRWLEEKL